MYLYTYVSICTAEDWHKYTKLPGGHVFRLGVRRAQLELIWIAEYCKAKRLQAVCPQSKQLNRYIHNNVNDYDEVHTSTPTCVMY